MNLRTPSRLTCWILLCAGTAQTACTRSKQYEGGDDTATATTGPALTSDSATGGGASNSGNGSNDTSDTTSNAETTIIGSGGATSGAASGAGTGGDSGAGGDPRSGGDGAAEGAGIETSGSEGSHVTSSGGSTTTGSSGSGGSSTSATGGSGGSTSDEPRLGGACESGGELACNGAAQKLQLICEAGIWMNNGSCEANENCEQASGVCAPIDEHCEGFVPGDRYCDDKTVRECGPDQVSSEAVAECAAACLVFEGQGRCVKVKQVAAGRHSCAVLDSGQLRCWGYNADGQLGYGHTDTLGDQDFEMPTPDVPLGERVLQVSVAQLGSHTCALLQSGLVRCWGNNTYGQLGLGHTLTVGAVDTPTADVELGEPATQIVTGTSHSCALLSSGAVRCWGQVARLGLATALGNEGDDAPPTENVPLGAKALQLSAGHDHTCALIEGGAIRCWGLVQDGGLGIPEASTLTPEVVPTVDLSLIGSAKFVAAGGYASCFINEYDNAYCWGDNSNYQLGNGNDEDLGRAAGDMPPTSSVILDGDALQVGVSSWVGCALMASQSVRCWGRTDYAGYGTTGFIGDVVGELSPADVPLGGPAVGLSVGQYATCAILASGVLRCWGDNSDGELGYGQLPFVGATNTPAEVGDVPVF